MEFTSAVKAWQTAVDVLPKANLTPAERQQQAQYTGSLQKAQERLDAFALNPFPGIVSGPLETPPWKAAEEMLPGLHAAGRAMFSSSAYVIHHANQDFEEGVGYINMLKKVPIKGAPKGYGIVGHTEGLTCITNGLMRDMRVFRMDSSNWLDKFNDQVNFEAEKRRAWTSDSLENIKQKALDRLKKEGWNDVRPALAVVVRARLMRAILDSKLRQAPHVAVERMKEILQILQWGRQIWRDVPKDDRGAVFQDTFVRGIKAIYLETLMSAHAKAAAADKQGFLDALLDASRELVEDMEKESRQPSSTEPVDPGFVSSFYVYPTAEAYAVVGYCFVQMAQSSENLSEKMTCYALAIKQYTQAAQALPDDDEKHCWYLNCTIDPMLRTGAPKDVIMGIVEKIREAMPKMQKIWANSALAKEGRDAMIETTLRVAESKLS
ncbi:hypothetical protein JVT61DRAFT_4455 [Boletus reticuloceps]|uniref:Uncharacterized protein n=1 Tax=Boletus reticuloceps TaxID=495285 RepID=A0A8I3A8X7_9AGAM|nr:hypothetical protein JVT61DRAFT_4455 [Boletus reticuloceps]